MLTPSFRSWLFIFLCTSVFDTSLLAILVVLPVVLSPPKLPGILSRKQTSEWAVVLLVHGLGNPCQFIEYLFSFVKLWVFLFSAVKIVWHLLHNMIVSEDVLFPGVVYYFQFLNFKMAIYMNWSEPNSMWMKLFRPGLWRASFVSLQWRGTKQ